MSTDAYANALSHNAEWVSQVTASDPDLLPTLGQGQSPQILWIGCSDSRVPETTLLGLKPGDVFVHRNIANVLHTSDLSSAAVIEFAVNHLKVAHIILCGHTKCGGVAASLGNASLGVLDSWLLPLRALRERYAGELSSVSAEGGDVAAKLGEISVREGVRNLLRMGNVIKAVKERGLVVHGIVYDVGTGKIKEIETSETEEEQRERLQDYETS